MDTRATGCYPSRCRKQLCCLLFAYEFKHCSRVSVAHCLNICFVVLCCICVCPSSCTRYVRLLTCHHCLLIASIVSPAMLARLLFMLGLGQLR
ncbi:hypothetical protein BDZ97DRAFT_1861944 [Flammula alnicola]|nr:hypothetical protein BDZ97DRAFT_1861944 [Flammula alnicola]